MRFLIVDDSSTMRRIIINTLNKLGYQKFLEAGNGREGIERLGAGADRPDDHGLEHAGDERHRLRANLRSTPHGKAVPVLMVTTNAANDDVVEALKAGVNNYVVKPFTAETMKEKIDAVARTLGAEHRRRAARP